MTFNLSTSQKWFSKIFLDSLSHPNHSAKFWLGWIPKIPRKCTVLRLQPFENSILGFWKVEIMNFETSVRASHGRRADASDHEDIEWRGTHKYSTSKRFAKENSSHAKKETSWLGWFYLFEYHILDMLDTLKQLKHLVKFWQLTRNSDSWFACDSELFFSIVDLPNFSGGMLSSGATNHWKPQRFFGKRSGSWQVFSPYKSFGRKVFGYRNGKNVAFSIHMINGTFGRGIIAYK